MVCGNIFKALRNLIAFRGVKVFFLKYVTITTVTTATVTTVTITTVTIWVFGFYHNFSFWVLSQSEFSSFVTICLWVSLVTIWVFEFCHNLCFWVLSQFEFLSFVTIWPTDRLTTIRLELLRAANNYLSRAAQGS